MEKYKARGNNIDSEVGEMPEKSYSEQKQESTEKAVDIAGRAVLDAYTGNMGSKIMDAAKEVPIVGGVVDKTWNKAVKGVSNIASKTPAGDVLKKADDAGLTDAVGTVSSIKNGQKPNLNSVSNTSSNVSNTSNNSNIFGGLLGNNEKSSSMFDLGSFSGSGTFKTGFKFKIIIAASCAFLFLIMFTALVFGADDIINLGLTNNSAMTPSSGSFTGNVDSSLFSGGTATMLGSGETLLSRLGQGKIDLINQQIKSDVESAGIGTGGAVATAAYDFIKLLLDEGINMTYTYGGEHGLVKEGIQSSWGYGNGLDCSSFVSWAMYNGGCKNDTIAVVSGTQATYGIETTADKLKAGDIVANSEHVMLVLNNTGSTLVVAHASSPTNGIIFSERSYDVLREYQLRDMTNYYQENCSS